MIEGGVCRLDRNIYNLKQINETLLQQLELRQKDLSELETNRTWKRWVGWGGGIDQTKYV